MGGKIKKNITSTIFFGMWQFTNLLDNFYSQPSVDLLLCQIFCRCFSYFRFYMYMKISNTMRKSLQNLFEKTDNYYLKILNYLLMQYIKIFFYCDKYATSKVFLQ